jgi:tRNA(Ile)-lysidine synthase
VAGPAPAVAAVRVAVRGALRPLGTAQVLVACSGGPDSVALAAATAVVARALQLPAGLVTIDHGLQPGSADRAAAVAGLGRRLGLDPVLVVPVRVGTAGGPEAAARQARYAGLTEAAATAGAGYVLLGHTLDDQAETVLLGLGRGSGPRSVAGMRPVDPPWLRPLLGVRRETTAAACRAEGLDTWADPHNTDRRYTRVRLRQEALPLLEDVLAGGVAEALARTATLLREDLDALDAEAGRVTAALGGVCPACLSPSPSAAPRPATESGLPDSAVPPAAAGSQAGGSGSAVPSPVGDALDVVALAGHPAAIRGRVLRGWLAAAGVGALTSAHLAALDALVTGWRGQGPVGLPGGLAAFRRHGRLHLGRAAG